MHTIDSETSSHGCRKRRRAIAIDSVHDLSCGERVANTGVNVEKETIDLRLGMAELSRIRLETETLRKALLQRDRRILLMVQWHELECSSVLVDARLLSEKRQRDRFAFGVLRLQRNLVTDQWFNLFTRQASRDKWLRLHHRRFLRRCPTECSTLLSMLLSITNDIRRQTKTRSPTIQFL